MDTDFRFIAGETVSVDIHVPVGVVEPQIVVMVAVKAVPADNIKKSRERAAPFPD
jgi:hypothetical protein